MLADGTGTGTQPTEQSVLSVFEDALSEEPEYKDNPETQPTQKSPESEPETAEVAPSTEQGEAEDGESEATEETDEETPEESGATALDPNLLVKVKVNGEEREIPLHEALRGYSRTEDYTRKTQELSAQRKQAEEHIQAVRAQREQYASHLVELEQALKDATPQEPDWVKMQQETPEEFPAEYARWAQYKERMNALSAERQKAVEQVQKDQLEQVKAHLAAENEKLLEAVPEWRKDPAKAKAEKVKLAQYATETLGFTREDLSGLRDHRAMLLLRKAMQYDELQAKKPTITARIQEKVKAATPGSGNANRQPPSKGKLAMQRLAKSGSQDDLEAVFRETVLGDL